LNERGSEIIFPLVDRVGQQDTSARSSEFTVEIRC
jgi:hypothetical protein